MCLLKRKAGIDEEWFVRELIDKNSYAICFQCSSPVRHGGICPWNTKCKCDRLIILQGGLTFKGSKKRYAYVKKEI